MGGQAGVMIQILLGVIGALVFIGFVTNTIEWFFSGLKKIAEQFPEQPVRTDTAPDTGEHSCAVTREKYTTESRGRFLGGLGCLGLIVSVAWFAAGIGVVVAFTTGALPARPLWLAFIGAAYLSWAVFLLWWGYRVVSTKAWHRLVKWTADDEHLHIRAVTSVGAPSNTISIPWAALEPLDLDPVDATWVRASAGRYWLHAHRAMFEREIGLRGELTLGDAAVVETEARSMGDASLQHRMPSDDDVSAPGRPAQTWDDLESGYGGTNTR